jgi:hypothetical protein
MLVLAYNLVHFGAIFGGQSELEAIRLRLQGLPRVWGNLAVGTVGTLLSPNRGLLVFCPWVAATALVLAAARARPTATPLVAPLLVGLAAHLVVVAGYSAWWAGWCFGPRYWTEAIPVLAILYAMALDRATRTQTVLPVAGGVVAIAIHAVGSVCYPSSWNATPAPVGVRHERVWDWRDTEVGRELREGPRPRDFPIGVP